jgi:hypothetical protein
MQDAVLTGARLRETHLERANLAGVTGLTWEQGEDAYTDENTILPQYLLPEGARQSAIAVVPPPPTPAARRTPLRTPARAVSQPAPPPPSAPQVMEPKDNVVQLKPPTRRTRRATAAKPKPAEAKPKKAALPKHRKPGLVKPA